MRRLQLLFFLLLFVSIADAQQEFQTIVTPGPVAVGESFQVQYVLEDIGKEEEFFAPDFKGFRFVSGPNIYTGSAFGVNGSRKLKNIVYTLEALQTGSFIIPGASVRMENRLLRSRNVSIQVVSKAEAMRKRKIPTPTINEDTYLAPGEDAALKTKRNLFIKVMVDKRACFVGEPVTAIFKLYSRLDSKSDIVKNPGFYGFTVQDMISLEDKQTATEKIDGKDFDVHIVRKVQLYPLQAGQYMIDAMEVRNKVRYSKSAVNHKPEQEIIEGVIPQEASAPDGNAVVFENTMATNSIPITVNALPIKNKPVDYTGATGNFKLQASLTKKEYARNEEGELIVTVSGRGNFPQLAPPAIHWPAGIEGFEPTIKDELDPQYSPLQGKREFHFRFVSARAGAYELPEIKLSFFNPDTNNYKVITSASLPLTIQQKEKAVVKPSFTGARGIVPDSINKWWLLVPALLICILGLFYFRKRQKSKQVETEPIEPKREAFTFLQSAHVLSGADEKTFYKALRKGIWDFFAETLGLTGSGMSKSRLNRLLADRGVGKENAQTILDILDRCETGMFTTVEDPEDKPALLNKTAVTLENIQAALRKN